ncbi:hypothetical protein DN748_08865 [Sinomicrobium soli]|nr:hypothetical protein DN748_08865 [Sinomicrobium sp. N-1-3-6]
MQIIMTGIKTMTPQVGLIRMETDDLRPIACLLMDNYQAIENSRKHGYIRFLPNTITGNVKQGYSATRIADGHLCSHHSINGRSHRLIPYTVHLYRAVIDL